MSCVDYYISLLGPYEQHLISGEWPLPDSGVVDLNLDIGVDPSMSSSGVCLILRKDAKIFACRTLNHKTPSSHPPPVRLGSLTDQVQRLVGEILEGVQPCRLHITVLFEIPPTHMSSSGWLYALSQFMWLGFGPSAPAFQELLHKGFSITHHQFGCGNTQIKHIYLHWSNQYAMGIAFKDISQKKSAIVKIVNQAIDFSDLRPYLPKRFNNDVAEAIALSMCAGACSLIRDYTIYPETAPYGPVPMAEIHSLMTSQRVNRQNEKIGWIFRPLTYSFGWSSGTSPVL